MSKRFSCFIFDLDDALLQTDPIWQECFSAAVEKSGISWHPHPDLSAQTLPREWASLLCDTFALSAEAEDVQADVLDLLRQKYQNHLSLDPGTQTVLKDLSSSSDIALTSSSERELLDIILANFDTENIMGLVCGEDLGRAKPDPEIYLRALDLLGADPSETLIVEASPAGTISALETEANVAFLGNRSALPQELIPSLYLSLSNLSQLKSLT